MNLFLLIMCQLFDCKKCVARVSEERNGRDTNVPKKDESSESEDETDSGDGTDSDEGPCDCCSSADIGDILYIDGEYRATMAYIMGPNGWESLSELGPGQGSGAVPARISKYISDPISFFSDDVLSSADICEVELDTEAHSEVLKELTGGREVHKSLKVRLDYDGTVILTTVPCVNGKSREITLNSSVDSIYLTGVPLTSPDPLMIAENAALLKEYNATFEKNTVPGSRISYNLRTENSCCGGDITIGSRTFNASGEIVQIVGIDKYHLGLVGVDKTSWSFVPVNDPYLSVPVWTCYDFDFPDWGKAESFTLNWKYSQPPCNSEIEDFETL